jgi:hypothetical protein
MIPKLIHQIWIGSKPAPSNHMNTWKQMNPSFTYHYWNEAEFEKNGITFECQHRIDEMEEIVGKADIIRLELLYRFGGVYIDADSICVEPIDDRLLQCPYFAGWENERVRPGLIATGTMGFPPRHPLLKGAIEWIKGNRVNTQRAWKSVGPGLLTRMYNTGKYNDGVIFPSYSFLPIHYTGDEYKGHGKIYAYQEWGSTKQNYDIMDTLTLPVQFTPPAVEESVSILICSFNTPEIYIQQCLQSIAGQEGRFHMELVWVNDGSDEIHTNQLRSLLDQFEKSCRFTTVVYMKNEENRGVGYSLNRGVLLCSHEIIMRMDSDDVMINTRVWKQFEFMKKNPTVQICSAQIQMFNESFEPIGQTNHPSISFEQYKQIKSPWFMNHPATCFRKSAMVAAGNYDETWRQCEDFECFLRMLKRYGFVYNFQEVMVYYRIHSGQINKNIRPEVRTAMQQLVLSL